MPYLVISILTMAITGASTYAFGNWGVFGILSVFPLTIAWIKWDFARRERGMPGLGC